jgi:hypothetical protein
VNAADFVDRLRERGLYVQLDDDRLLLELEDGCPRPTDEERRLLKDLTPQLVAHLRGVDWSQVSLYALDRVLEIAVPWSDVPLVLAPGCRIAGVLREHDPLPGRVWCVCEVCDLLLKGMGKEDARKIAETKLAFGGVLVGVRRERKQ